MATGKKEKKTNKQRNKRRIDLEGEFLDAALGLAQVLLGVGVAALLSVQFLFQFADPLFQLDDGLLASLEGVGLGFVEAVLDERKNQKRVVSAVSKKKEQKRKKRRVLTWSSLTWTSRVLRAFSWV